MKEKEPPIVPTSTLSPELTEIFTKGIPASIDGDAVHDRMLLQGIDFGLGVRYGKRAQLFRDWLALPNVTLSQAAWLLAGRDPFNPLGAEPEPPPNDLQHLYLSILNQLECEAISGPLKPIGRAVAGLERRFSLLSTAHTALRLDIAEGSASQAILIAEQIDKTERAPIAWQSQRVAERIEVHRKLIEIIRAQQPEAVRTLALKARRKRNRRAQVEAISLRLPLRSTEYDFAFRSRFNSDRGGDPEYHITALMLRQDRDQLNIKLKTGRPRTKS